MCANSSAVDPAPTMNMVFGGRFKLKIVFGVW